MPVFTPARLSLAPGGPAWAPAALAVEQPQGEAPRTVYRALLHLRFSTGGADEIVIDEAATAIRGRFLPADRDTRTASPGEAAAAVAATGGGLRITLSTSRRLENLRLQAAKGVTTGSKIRVHRVDGEAVADKPTVTATNSGLLSPDLARTLALDRSVAPAFEGASPVAGIGSGLTDLISQASNPRYFSLPGGPPFEADRFALFLDDPLDRPVPLAPGDLETVGIRTFPAGPRIGLALLPSGGPGPGADPLAQPDFFFRAEGLVGGGEVPLAAGQFDAGADLAQALRRALARLEAPLPATVDVALVLASDAPCRVEITALTAGFRLVRSSWPASEAAPAPTAAPDRAKRSVRLGPGSASDGLAPAIELPAGARLESARIAGSLRLGAHRPPDSGLDPLALAAAAGVEIAEGTTALQGIAPTGGAVTAVALPLLPLARETAVRLEILEDAGGEVGRVIATAELGLERAGARRWAVLPFSRPATLPARPAWLRLTATRGSLVWLARSGPGSIRRTEAPSPSGLPLELPPIAGHQAIHELLAATGPGEPAEPAAQVALRLGEAQILSSAREEGQALFDFTAALSTLLAANPPGQPLVAGLAFASDFSGQLTLTPSRLEYSIG